MFKTKYLIYGLVVVSLFLLFKSPLLAKEELKGKILIQTESLGEAWYVLPDRLERVYLGRPWQAYELMKDYGLGISSVELDNYLNTSFPARLSGHIVLDVQRNGEAYYVYPNDLKGYYLGRPNDAFTIMRNLGLGISNEDLILIPSLSQEELIAENEEEIIEKKEDEEEEEKQGPEALEIDENIVVPNYHSDMPTMIKALSQADALVQFLNNNFTLNDNSNLQANNLDVFYQEKEGSQADFANFISFILAHNNYQAGVIRYQFQGNDNLAVVYRDGDLPKYIAFSDSGLLIYHHGWSFKDLIKNEEKRLNITIDRYLYFPAKSNDFALEIPPYSWQELK